MCSASMHLLPVSATTNSAIPIIELCSLKAKFSIPWIRLSPLYCLWVYLCCQFSFCNFSASFSGDWMHELANGSWHRDFWMLSSRPPLNPILFFCLLDCCKIGRETPVLYCRLIWCLSVTEDLHDCFLFYQVFKLLILIFFCSSLEKHRICFCFSLCMIFMIN